MYTVRLNVSYVNRFRYLFGVQLRLLLEMKARSIRCQSALGRWCTETARDLCTKPRKFTAASLPDWSRARSWPTRNLLPLLGSFPKFKSKSEFLMKNFIPEEETFFIKKCSFLHTSFMHEAKDWKYKFVNKSSFSARDGSATPHPSTWRCRKSN